MTKLRCIIWCAVSSQAQNEPDKISLPQQEADARTLAEDSYSDQLEVVEPLITIYN